MFRLTAINAGVLLAISGGLFSTLATAQQSGAEPKAERVEVTGSRIKSINVEGVSPVVTVSDKEIKTDGVRNVESLINNLPQAFADQGGNVVNGSTGTAAVNLRGLGSDRTLVLVNGRRMSMGSPNTTSTSPDLNQIPAALIKRVEILTGGASAIYGSDAVAGVVNFILNDKFDGFRFDVNTSFFNHQQQGTAGVADLVKARAATNPNEFKIPGDKSSDGKSTDLSVLMGSNFANNKGNATFFLSYKKDDALLQSERDFSACSLSSGAAGFACGGSGTNATGRITNLTNGKVFTTADSKGTARAFNNATDQYNFGPLNHYQRPSERYSGNAFVHYDISEMAKAYGEFGFHDDRTVAQIAPGGAFGSIHTVKFDNPLLSDSWKQALGLLKAGDTTDIVLQRRNVEGGGRQSEYRNTSFRSVLGFKGDVGNWSYDTYLIRSKVIFSQNEKNYFLSPRIDRAMDIVNVNGKAVCASAANGTDPSCVAYNPWALGGVTADQLAYLQTPGFRKGSVSQEMEGLTLSSDLGTYGLTSPWAKTGLSLAFGAEHRRDSLELTTDPATEAGDLSGSGGPTKGLEGTTSVRDVFLELNVPIVEKRPFVELLTANLAYRNSSYGTGIKADTYGIGGEYSPVKGYKIRTSYQRAIRAPNVIELFRAQGNNLFDMDADPCAGANPTATLDQCKRTGVTAAQYGTIQDSPAGQYIYLAGGNPNLAPEVSDSWTIGAAMQPTRDLAFTLDYFDIKVKETIDVVDPSTTLNKCLTTGSAAFCSQITRDRLGTLWLLDEAKINGTNRNIGSKRTNGIDLGVGYGLRLPSEMGRLDFNYLGTYLLKFEKEEIPGDGSFDCVGYYGANKCKAPNPKYRHKFRTTWSSPWAVDVSMTWRHFDKVALQSTSSNPLLAGPSNAVDRVLGARDYLDLAFSWKASKWLTVSGGVNNILDTDPPITSQLSTGQGNGNTYPSIYDALGRKVFMSATIQF
jgi:iron complex outermembrane receptor protein